MSVSVCVGGGVRAVAASVRACVGCLCIYICRGWVARATPQTAVCKHFCSPRVLGRRSCECAGKGAWVRLLRGACAEKGLRLGAKQQHRAMPPSWAVCLGGGCRLGEEEGADSLGKSSDQDIWRGYKAKTYSILGLNTDFPKFGVG